MNPQSEIDLFVLLRTNSNQGVSACSGYCQVKPKEANTAAQLRLTPAAQNARGGNCGRCFRVQGRQQFPGAPREPEVVKLQKLWTWKRFHKAKSRSLGAVGYSWGFLLSLPADAEYDMTPAASWGIEGGQDD